MPDRMVRSVPVPSSRVNCSSFFDFGTAMHSFTFTARKSDLLKVSKSTSSSKRGSMTTLEKSMGLEGSALAASAAQVATGAPSAGAFSVAHTGLPSPSTSSFMWGNSSTSRMDGASVSSMTKRSIPMPTPPAGGMPYSNARM